MENTFREDMEIIANGNINKIVQLDKMLKKIKNGLCGGEINILDKERNVLVQTHYEYFTMFIHLNKIIIGRYNRADSIETLDYTNIDGSKITKYEVNNETLSLEGELDSNTIINILAVFKESKGK